MSNCFLCALQTCLAINVPRHRPLWKVDGSLCALGELPFDPRDIRALIEQSMVIAFNIALHLNSAPEYRILDTSIAWLRSHGGRKPHELEWPQIMRQIIRHQKPILTGVEARRALTCDRGHVENLILAGELEPLKKSQPGPGGSWTISRRSFETFLQRRRQ